MVHRSRKTNPPLLPSPILCREKLLQKLEKALFASDEQQSMPCKLVLLRAAAGYGKTTLLADFIQRYCIPTGWYFLDHTDAQIAQFIEIFTVIFLQEFPTSAPLFPSSFLQELVTDLQSGTLLQRQQVLERYTDILEQHIVHPFILCLCNYQKVNENEYIQIFLNHLLHTMPSKLTLVIESRVAPTLELSHLLAYRQLLGLGDNDLSFSAQEMQEYIKLQHGSPITEEEAERLVRTFDGWIVGMLLATPLGNPATIHTADSSSASWLSPTLVTDTAPLLAYIRHDVFATEYEAFAFLQETSPLVYLNAPKCNHILQIEHADATLTHIEKQGLFLTRTYSQGNAPTYTFHSTLRQILLEDLRTRCPERVESLYRRAAAFSHAQGNDEQAIAYAIAAQDYTLAMDIMVEVALAEPDDSKRQANVARCFEMLPAPVREQHAHLLFLRATAYLLQHEYLCAAPLLEKAYQLVLQQPLSSSDRDTNEREEYSPTLLAEILIAQSALLFQESKYLQAQQLCLEALEHLSIDKTELRVPALLRLGICKTLLGNYEQGLSYLQQALLFSGYASMTQQTAYIHTSLANTYSLICNYALEEHHRARAIVLYERLKDSQGKINNLIWVAILKRKKGAFQEAEALLQDILMKAREAGLQDSEAYALFNLGAHYIDVNALSQALLVLEESLYLARQIGDHRLTDQCLCELATVYLLLGDNPTAQVLLTQTTVATMERTGQPAYEAIGYELIRSTALLYQKEFAQASRSLEAFEHLAEKAQLKRASIECLIRLAVCQYELGNWSKMEEAMKKVVQIVAQGYFEYVPLIELRRFPEAWQAIQKLSEQACLNAWRDKALESEEEEETQKQKSHAATPVVEFAPFTKASISIQAFGEPGVQINGTPTRWRMARSLEICFFLLDYQRPMRKEQLVEALWSEEEEYVDQTVRSALHHLRKTLGGACLLSQGGMYTLALDVLYGENIWYDVSLFQERYTQAQEALRCKDDERAETSLLAMVDLYCGDYVQSFYSNWCIPRRDELRMQYMNARRELAHIAWRKEHYEESMGHWQQILAIDPCSEEAHYGLMRCYTRLGKRSLAVRQYQSCADILQRELALSPGASVQKFYQRLTSEYPEVARAAKATD